MSSIFSIVNTSLVQIIIAVFFVVQGSSLYLAAQTHSRVVPLGGFVFDERDSSAISNVHIINLNRVRGTTSDNTGAFTIWANEGDSIMFQAVGFLNDTLRITADIMEKREKIFIPLKEKIYQLPTVEVFPYATFQEFKYAFLNFEDPDPPFELDLPPLDFQPDPGESSGIIIPGPITALYDRFSRRGRELAKYRELTEEAEIARRASRIVNYDIIKRLTGIESEQEYYIFMDFCNMSYEYIVSTKEYIVYQRILQCYKQYAALK
ncbi:MAG: hypothetical protein EA393_05070 [Bacteroidetes bacterium]|nr:MAG: hypothetical protein EA393_05070 [Bacteroidota bacterium]